MRIEPERYELFEVSAYQFELERRDFFKLLGGGIVLLLALPGAAQESGGGRRGGNALPQEASAWMHIGEDSRVTFFTGKVEIGQNIRTSLTQAVAEELHTPPATVQLVMADTELTPFDMGTFGSLTTPTMAPQLRRVAAAAREWLIELAAAEWGVERGMIRVADGKVLGGEKFASFGELSNGKNLVRTVGHETTAKPTGQSLPKVAVHEMVTGEHRYTSDLTRPGMLYGRMLRPAGFDARLTSVDTKAAEQIPGIRVVKDREFIGVVGAEPAVLPRAIEAIQAKWETPPQPSNKELFTYLKANVQEGRSPERNSVVAEALERADHKVEASYQIAYIAHVPLEPRAAVAEWSDDKLTVWTGTQRPFGVREELAKAFQIPTTKVRVIVPDTGSAYGGKHTGECAIEAARLARAAGKPVKLVWTREEEFSWAYFRPAGVIDVRGAVNKDAKLTAWEFHNYNSGGSGLATPYEVDLKAVSFHPTKSPLRQGSYRGLAATANHFARESHMDDLARAVGIDPLDFRCRNLKDERMVAVLRAAADRFGWGKTATPGQRGFGIACGFEKGGYVASCVEVSVGPRVKIERVVTAFECGAIVNPEHLKNQVEGAVMMGVGGALFEEIQFADGRILNGRLSKYRVPRFSDMPVMETVLIDRKDLASAGAGETPIVGLAPAVGNAIFDATGRRLRNLPMGVSMEPNTEGQAG
jgi:nicotinate dehydrogenase subunit B